MRFGNSIDEKEEQSLSKQNEKIESTRILMFDG